MHRLILILALLLIATPARSQTRSDSQTLQALLVEVRQLRHDLRTTTVAAQRAQILIYRVQAQESIVRSVQERVDDTRSKLAQIRSEQKRLAAAFKEIADSLNNADNPATTRKEAEQTMAGIKAGLEIQASNEQEAQAKLTESEDQLRVEQAKLVGLQDQLDRLETQLEDSTRQTGSNPSTLVRGISTRMRNKLETIASLFFSRWDLSAHPDLQSSHIYHIEVFASTVIFFLTA